MAAFQTPRRTFVIRDVDFFVPVVDAWAPLTGTGEHGPKAWPSGGSRCRSRKLVVFFATTNPGDCK